MTFDQMIKKGNSTTRALRTIEKEKKGILNREEADRRIEEASDHPAAKALADYVKSNPADIDKQYYHTAAGHIAAGRHKELAHHIKSGDTAPRDHVLDQLEKHDKPLHKAIMHKAGYEKIREDAEQIDEISGKTLASYSDKVARYGPMKDVRTRQKHEKGVYTAYKKMKAKNVKVPARMEEADVPFEGPYRKTGERKDKYGNTVKNVAKHLAKKAMKKQMGGLKKEEAEQIDELSKATLGSYVKKAKKELSSSDYHIGRAVGAREVGANFSKSPEQKLAAKAVERSLAAKSKKRYHGIDKAVDKLTKEEAEQIDEISAKTIDRYREQSHRKEYPGPKGSKKYEKRARGSIMAFNKLTGRAKVPARMEEAEIIEARGRPRKDAQKDYTIHPKTKEKLMHNNPAHMKRIEALHRTGALQKPKVEAGQNIITQLRKASTSMRGGEKVNFNYGASTHVSAAHAQKILDKHAGMRPAEKEKFQKDIGHSHAMLKKHV
jgi:hypothetical protein